MTRTKLEEAAWVLIANVSDGKWNQQPDQWQRAAERWRDEYHETADQTKNVPDSIPIEWMVKLWEKHITAVGTPCTLSDIVEAWDREHNEPLKRMVKDAVASVSDKPCSCNTCNEIRTEPSSKLERDFARESLQHAADKLEQEAEWWDDTAIRDKTCREIALFCKGICNGFRSSAKLLRNESAVYER